MPKKQEISEIHNKWLKDINTMLVGQTIKECRLMTQEELEATGWESRAVVIQFKSGHSIFASQDDEGNGPGAIFTTFKKLPTIPVF